MVFDLERSGGGDRMGGLGRASEPGARVAGDGSASARTENGDGAARAADSLVSARMGEKDTIGVRRRPAPLASADGPQGGLQIERLFTRAAPTSDRPIDPFDTVEWDLRSTRITNPDGSVVFQMDDVEVPRGWSQVASDILASKYLRKAGVPQVDENGSPVLDDEGRPVTTRETSARQVISRLVRCWRHWGEQYGYFNSTADAEVFEAELAYMLLHQMAAPNSPQWFNTGLHLAYGLSGPAQGHYFVDPITEELRESDDAYSRPQPHACFIQSVRDDLVNEGGIMDLWLREARLFKYGSGTGTNFSQIRGEGEPLSGGGVSSGLMSFLKIGDRAAGAIKSGGTTRRAAKMVCLDLDHPDIEAFVNWKAEEEKKVAAMIAAGYTHDFNGEAYQTVSGQNSNNSVRIPDAFLRSVLTDGEWALRWRTDGRVARTLRARSLWKRICEAAWACADPGVQFDSTINAWNTCPNDGRINASNPCSEYMFLDDTACNLASLNLMKFYDAERDSIDVRAYRHAVRLWTVVLEISVLMAQYPSREIALRSHRYRTLGLGYANLGTLLMVKGIPYHSEEGRSICAALTAILTGESYATSAEMARELGPFPAYERNAEAMLRVIRNHRRAAYNARPGEYEGLEIVPQGLKARYAPEYLVQAAQEAWDRALLVGEQFGYRNAQATVLAPTGTIGLLMDCDTTGIEPDFALVKFKKLAGGGFFKIVNRSVPLALRHLGYSQREIDDALEYLVGTNNLQEEGPEDEITRQSLRAKGLTAEDLEKIESQLPQVFDLRSAFSPWIIGEEAMRRLGFDSETYTGPDFDFLERIGFTSEAIEGANDRICGRHTLEGAPHVKPEHLAVFECANRCGRQGHRFIHYLGHIQMIAAAQSFISGAISKTINLPNDATIEDIERAYMESWKLGLKANALYRDGCKLSQPLSSKQAIDTAEADRADAEEAIPAGDAQVEQRESAPVTRAAPALSPGSPRRRSLPSKRMGFTQEARVGGHKIYLRTGNYEDGALGEIFVDMHKEGAAFRSIMNCFAIAVSKGLQYGVPLEEFVETFTFTRFAPQGTVQGHPNLKMATSILDYVFRVLAIEYLGRTDFAHVKPNGLNDGDPADSSAEVSTASRGDDTDAGRAGDAGAGAGGGEAATPVLAGDASRRAEALGSATLGAQNEQLSEFMGDAPVCDVCGHITVRNGACYRCLNCGNSMGCS